jgi:hypothetical protein
MKILERYKVLEAGVLTETIIVKCTGWKKK